MIIIHITDILSVPILVNFNLRILEYLILILLLMFFIQTCIVKISIKIRFSVDSITEFAVY